TARNDQESEASLKVMEETLGDLVKGQMVLTGFSVEQMTSLLTSYLGSSSLEPAIVELFFTKSNGNPFIATEYLRALVDQGFLIFKNSQWHLASGDLQKLAFSKDVYAIILERIGS